MFATTAPDNKGVTGGPNYRFQWKPLCIIHHKGRAICKSFAIGSRTSDCGKGAVSVSGLWGSSAGRVNKSEGQALLRGTQSPDASSQQRTRTANPFGFSVPTDRHKPCIRAWGAARERHSRSAPFRLHVQCVPGWVSNRGPRVSRPLSHLQFCGKVKQLQPQSPCKHFI